jgi:hypothetical protein
MRRVSTELVSEERFQASHQIERLIAPPAYPAARCGVVLDTLHTGGASD